MCTEQECPLPPEPKIHLDWLLIALRSCSWASCSIYSKQQSHTLKSTLADHSSANQFIEAIFQISRQDCFERLCHHHEIPIIHSSTAESIIKGTYSNTVTQSNRLMKNILFQQMFFVSTSSFRNDQVNDMLEISFTSCHCAVTTCIK